MKKIIPLLIAGVLTLSFTTTAFAKSITSDNQKIQIRMMVVDPDDPRPKL